MDLQTDLSVLDDTRFIPTPSASMSAILAIWLTRGLAHEAADTQYRNGFPSQHLWNSYKHVSYVTGFRSSVTMREPTVFGIGRPHMAPPEPISECDVITASYNCAPDLDLDSGEYRTLNALIHEYDQAVGHLGISDNGADPMIALQNMDPLAFDDPALHMQYESEDRNRDASPHTGLGMYADQWMNVIFSLFGTPLSLEEIPDAMTSSCIAMPQELLDWWPQGDDQHRVKVSWPYGWDVLDLKYPRHAVNVIDDVVAKQQLHRLLLRAMYMSLQNTIASGSAWDLNLGSMCESVHQTVLAHGGDLFAQVGGPPAEIQEGYAMLCGPDTTDDQLCSIAERQPYVVLDRPTVLPDGRILIGLRANNPLFTGETQVTRHAVMIDLRTRSIRKEVYNA